MIKYSPMRALIVLPLLCLFGIYQLGLALENPQTLIVVGVQNESGTPDWDQQLVALGVTNLISEALFRTGRFIPIESHPEVAEALNQMVAYRRQSTPVGLQPDRPLPAPQVQSDAIAYGIIRRYEKSRKRAIAGLFSFSKVTVSLEIEIVVEENGGRVRSAVGKGNGQTRSKGVLVQIREEKIRFDQTSLGAVAGDAVQHAVSQIYPNR